MYKYSKKAQKELISKTANAFLLLNFAGSTKGREFIEQKEKGIAEQADQDRSKRIYAEIENLTELAKETLQLSQ